MRLEIGSMLVYGSRGVCKVEDIKKERFVKEEREYYLLRPMDDVKSLIYVPVDSDRLEKQVRRVLTPGEIDDLISIMPSEATPWIEDNRTRAEFFKSVMESGNREQMVQIIKTLYLHRQELAAVGKRLNVADETVLGRLEKLLYDEFALVLNIRPEEVLPFIQEKLRGEQEENAG
ncbi:MAG: CarD family transcriptional regulator [Eubacteriales bacterium]